jgi:hypothetical protein
MTNMFVFIMLIVLIINTVILIPPFSYAVESLAKAPKTNAKEPRHPKQPLSGLAKVSSSARW